MIALPAFLQQRWMIAILALAFVGVLQLVASGTAHAHAASHHSSMHSQNTDALQPLERQAAVVAPAIDAANHPGCPGHDPRTSNDHSTSCCGTPCCAAALAPTPDSRITLGNRLIATVRFYPLFVIADVVFGLDRPPDFRA